MRLSVTSRLNRRLEKLEECATNQALLYEPWNLIPPGRTVRSYTLEFSRMQSGKSFGEATAPSYFGTIVQNTRPSRTMSQCPIYRKRTVKRPIRWYTMKKLTYRMSANLHSMTGGHIWNSPTTLKQSFLSKIGYCVVC